MLEAWTRAVFLPGACAATIGIACAAADSQGWPTVGLDAAETRDSPLTLIRPDNISALKPAWVADLTGVSRRAFEATPLVVDGTLFVSVGWSIAVAYDAKSGRELWRFDPKVAKDYAAKGCCGPVSRGLAYADGHVFLAAFDGRLIALNSRSGAVDWQVNTVDAAKDYTITGAPRVAGGNVIIGNAGAEYGVRGYLTAYDVRTGRLAWRFYTVPPRPGTKDGAASDAILARVAHTWSGEWWKLGGGGTVWDAMAYDPELDLLYVGVGNGGPWNRQMRSAGRGDNLFLSSIVALRASTGAYVWHFQTTPGDEWDYTAAQSIILADLTLDGARRKVLMQAPKNGFFYVLDRQTGKFISGTPYVAQTWARGLDPVSGRPIENPSIRYSENGAPSQQSPGPSGAHNWQPMSFSAATGLAYIPVLNAGFRFVAADARYRFYQGAPNMGIDPLQTALPLDAASIEAARQSVYGELLAWDPRTRRVAWRVRQDVAWNGGTLVTASGLVFQGDAAGNLCAFDARTGDKRWSMNLGAGIVAAPMTYAIDEEQYVAVAVGWGGGFSQVAGALALRAQISGINRLVVLKLNGTATLPAVTAPAKILNPPAPTASDALVVQGSALFERRCYVCHGSRAISGGEVPDLRYSAALRDADAFRAIVLEGALAVNGMPGFARDLQASDTEALRAYIIERAEAKRREPIP
jgi:quinohemoprotein ethanol dehydrogenase